jgi:class 3 adenylate cyclase/sugar lactone lactonase YvrE
MKSFFFCDLRNYTEFVEGSGDAAAARLLREYRELVRRDIGSHRGAEIKTEGDSFYVVFDSPSRALACAIAIQHDVAEHNLRNPTTIRIGIGLHAGETVPFDRQYVGSAVNVASRLAGKAASGEILVSDTLRGLVRTGVAYPMVDRGPLELKGVSEPIRAWSVDWQTAAPQPLAARTELLRRFWPGVASLLAVAAIVIAIIAFAARPAEPREAAIPVAGLGSAGYSGDGGPATAAQLDRPVSLALDRRGNLYIADSTFQLGRGGVREAYTRIRRIDEAAVIQTVAGNGTRAIRDTSFAPDVRLNAEANIAIDDAGRTFFTQQNDPLGENFVGVIDGQQIRIVVSQSTQNGYAGDGGPAAAARVSKPHGLAIGSDGSLFIADSGNNVVRRVAPDGVITTIAGTGERGSSGDGGPPTKARFFAPTAVAVAPDGSLYIADTNNHTVRMIDHGGTLITVAGTGTPGFSGDGGRASAAQLDLPNGLAFDGRGVLYIADTGNNRIRRVGTDGTITTVLGDGTTTTLDRPLAVAVDTAGVLYVADTENHRVLRLRP